MSRVLVWIDRAHARLITYVGDAATVREMRWGHPDHHTHAKEGADHESAKFYEQVAHELGNAMEVFIVGAGVAKQHFHTFLREKHPALEKKVLGVETVDGSLTDGQLRDKGKALFLHADAMTATKPIAVGP